ncbi:MAG: dCTP deaminase, partial [Candidatus Micrarchaeota archaeon]|nr:dCTP deaminase [Candidatus Micrarchaeota archaeon]
MILADRDIRNEIKAGRLVFEPKLADDQIGPASVDLTLDGKFWIFEKRFANTKKAVDLKLVSFKEATRAQNSESIVLQPGGMCLGITKEKITVPAHLMGTLEGRSRYARMGLAVHVTSAMVQPGSDNHQVLEIVNFAPFPVKLHQGMRISQVVFEYMHSPTS